MPRGKKTKAIEKESIKDKEEQNEENEENKNIDKEENEENEENENINKEENKENEENEENVKKEEKDIKEFDREIEELEPKDKDEQNTDSTKDNEKKPKKVRKSIKPKVRKPRKSIEDSFKEIEPSEAANYTLCDLIKTRIIGDTMKSTLEREKALKQNQNSLLRHQRSQQQNQIPQPMMENDNSAAVEFVNGVLTVKSQSTELDPTIEDAPVLYESTDHITNFSFSKRTPSRRWSEAETREFIIALKKYGTDFSVLENVFPHRDRRQLKAKFKREQNENPNILDDIIKGKINYDMDDYRKQREEVSKQKKEREEKMNLKNDLMKLASENADPDASDNENDLDPDLRRASGSYGSGTLGSGKSKSSIGRYQEEVVMDTQQYEQQQQQQQTHAYDPYSMDNDYYGTNDYDF
ncbi:hypothetical protein DICPUDRAFT_76451 [Dictyostelium purpureum]|uniref:Myb-like domain-containing protein n=1 Tax=Dictyostelium purpureum TaxID=5786 RepID=F0ZDM7_DICPU|nr:uncharacterized protein DICPUDRAFT_76451 [Dictyostelium purpureum]EGC37942.1 hypothetical protein DICPUDRAFT_76451 [Dictyostelium purpureum]|eukprot:XP_003285513.1 hypothetical protein DICPUDRAFT_76451 [Dictyostelium purpureum]